MSPLNRRARLTALLTFLIVLCVGQILHHSYRWYVSRDDRAQLSALREQLVDAGAALVRAQLQADALRAGIEDDDRGLERGRRGVEAYGRHAVDGMLPNHLYAAYRDELTAFNARIAARNRRLDELNGAIQRRNAAAGLYNVLADSIKVVAARAGQPYFPIPLPAEAAVERGVVPGP